MWGRPLHSQFYNCASQRTYIFVQPTISKPPLRIGSTQSLPRIPVVHAGSPHTLRPSRGRMAHLPNHPLALSYVRTDQLYTSLYPLRYVGVISSIERRKEWTKCFTLWWSAFLVGVVSLLYWCYSSCL